MFPFFRSFIDRHRRKVLITGVILGGAYALGKLAQWKLGDWYESHQVELLVQSKKQLHFDGNQKTCNTTFYSLLPSLQDAIIELIETEAITEKLHLIKTTSDKLLLWEQLKILSFTRTVTAVYGSSLLAVFLRVQLNLLGGYMYLDVESEGSAPEEHQRIYMSDPTQQKYLGIVRYFLESGVKDLVDAIQRVVEGVLGSVSLKQKLSYHDIRRMLGQIRQCLKFSHPQQSVEGSTSQLKISSVVLPKDSLPDAKDHEDVIFYQLLNETADIVESEDFQVVFNACLDVGFMFVMKQIKSSFIVDQQDTPPDMICSIEDGLCSIHMPLAKICPIINGKATKVFSEDRNDYLHDIVSLECVKSFAANIYEAFSSRPKD